jgi:hypothetical protein
MPGKNNNTNIYLKGFKYEHWKALCGFRTADAAVCSITRLMQGS